MATNNNDNNKKQGKNTKPPGQIIVSCKKISLFCTLMLVNQMR